MGKEKKKKGEEKKMVRGIRTCTGIAKEKPAVALEKYISVLS